MDMSQRAPRVLYVDDDRVQLYILEKLLKDDIELTLAHNGHLGLEYIKLVPFDLILIDLDLGSASLSGEVLRKRIEASDKNANTPVYALSSHHKEGNEEKFLAQGFQRYFVKPPDYMELKHFILNDVSLEMTKKGLV